MRLACLLLLVPAPILLPACEWESSMSISGSTVSSDAAGASVGGYRLHSSEPTFFYGTVLDGGVRRFTYLVIAPSAGSDAVMSSKDASTATIGGGSIEASHDFEGKTMDFEARFTASVDPTSQRLTESSLQVQGREITAEDGWCFLADLAAKPDELVPVACSMPELPVDPENLDAVTTAFVTQLVADDPAVAAFLAGE